MNTSTDDKKTFPVSPGSSRRRFLFKAALTVGVPALGLYGVKLKQAPDLDAPPYRMWKPSAQIGKSHAEMIIQCGTLAANPHNSQPWKFQVKDGVINVFADRSRHLKSADVDNRMILMAVGSALENMRVAANKLGYRTDIRFVPGDRFESDGLCAQMHLLANTAPAKAEGEFEAIFTRQTNRGKYVNESVSDALLQRISASNDLANVNLVWYRAGSEQAKEVVRYTRHGVRQWVDDDMRHRDGMAWWRVNRTELMQKRDGISLHTSPAPFFVVEGMENIVTRAMWEGDFGKNGEINTVEEVINATPVWGLILADGVRNDKRVRGGALLERIYLAATREGYAVHPINYPTELELITNRMKRALGLPDASEPLIVLRFGRPEVQLERSVRRDLQSFMV